MTHIHALILNQEFQLTVYLFSDDRPDHSNETPIITDQINPFITQLGKLLHIEFQPGRMTINFQWDLKVTPLYPPLQPIKS